MVALDLFYQREQLRIAPHPKLVLNLLYNVTVYMYIYDTIHKRLNPN